MVHAYCYIAKDKRSFYLHHIIRIDDHDWEATNARTLLSGGGIDSFLSSYIRLLITLLTEKSSSIGATTIMPASVEEWLTKIGMSRYWEKLRDNGFDTFATLGELDELALDALGITMLGHKKHLMRMATELSEKHNNLL